MVLVPLTILFRGPLYRSTVAYTDAGKRENPPVADAKLSSRIEAMLLEVPPDLDGIVRIAKAITEEELAFTTGPAETNPNRLMHTAKANCVGYAATFASIASYLVKRYGLQEEIAVEHHVGHLLLFGINVHQLFDDPFFKDHDYNVVRDRRTGERVAVDVTVSDYLGVEWVRER